VKLTGIDNPARQTAAKINSFSVALCVSTARLRISNPRTKFPFRGGSHRVGASRYPATNHRAGGNIKSHAIVFK
jgi:hypothetical protein